MGAVVGDAVQPLVGGLQKTSHFLGRFAFDAHGHAKRAHFQIGHLAIEHLRHEFMRLGTRQVASAFFAATDFPNEVTDGHGHIVKHASSLSVMR